MVMRGIAAVAVLFMCTGSLFAQAGGNAGFQFREDDGGSVIVHTANGVLNQNSSLKRRWLAIDDLSSPVRLSRTGVFPHFDEKEQMQFLVPVGTVSPLQAISAIEVRYLLFDVWGQHLRTLSLTRLADSSTSVDLRESTRWPAWESEASQLVTVVAFVARVRTADGHVWASDAEKLAPQLQALGLNVTLDDLTPDEQRAIDPRAVYWMYYPTQKRPAANAPGNARR
jgi:hypothetical protein